MVLALAVLTTAAVFILIPITQFMAYEKGPKEEEAIQNFVLPPPEPPPPEEPPPPPEPPPEEEQEPPEPPKLSLEQIELSLEPGTGDLGGDFGMPGFDVNQKSLGSLDIFSVADLDSIPQALSQMPPRYPPSLRNQKVEGRAVVLFIVDTSGRVIEARVEEATHPDFGVAASEAILKWKFEPGLKNGQRVKFKMRIPIPFRL